jgi:hypothetical protein
MAFFWKLWPRNVAKVFSNVGVLMALWVCYNLVTLSGPLSAVSRMASRAADIGDVGASAVVGLSEASVAAFSKSLAVGQDFWQGVELTNLTMIKRRGYFVVDSAAILEAWWRSPAGAQAWPFPPELLERTLSSLEQVGLSLPALALHDQVLRDNNSDGLSEATRLAMSSTLDWDGYIRVDIMLIHSTFEPQWTNPMWWSNFDGYRQLVTSTLSAALNNTPFPEPAERAIDPSQYAAIPAFSFYKVLRYFRAQLLTIRWCLGIIIGGALEGPR